jgi:hypothetical protein
MKPLKAQIGTKTIFVNCDEDLRPQGEWLLAYLRKTFGNDPGPLRDGFKIQVGWSILCLRQQEAGLVVCEPNYRGNPFVEWHDDISCTLQVQMEQNELLEVLDVKEGAAALFQDKIVLAKGCLSEERIFLFRSKDAPAGDSGWYIGPTAGSEPAAANEAIHVYQLLKLRPALLQALALPPGSMVTFHGDGIEGWRQEE